MKHHISRGVFIIAFLSLAASLSAQEIVVSVSDFSVDSANENYAFLGKGISTLVAGELRRTKAIKLLEREQMNKIIEELKLSHSGLLDDSQQVAIGKLMAANYIVFGEIVDMVTSLLVSVRMADVTTGEVVWEDSLMEELETYDYIGAYFAKSILTELALDVEEETVTKVETKEVKQEEAIVALSTGIDAYDKGEEEKAKEELKTVQKLDPTNEVARLYLSKLQALSPKFRAYVGSGIAIPFDPLSGTNTVGPNIIVGFGFHLFPWVSLNLLFGYNYLNRRAATGNDVHLMNVSANARFFLPFIPISSIFSAYGGTGGGRYFDPGGTPDFRANVGAGINLRLNRHFALELGLDYHYLLTVGWNYLHGHIGVVRKF